MRRYLLGLAVGLLAIPVVSFAQQAPTLPLTEPATTITSQLLSFIETNKDKLLKKWTVVDMPSNPSGSVTIDTDGKIHLKDRGAIETIDTYEQWKINGKWTNGTDQVIDGKRYCDFICIAFGGWDGTFVQKPSFEPVAACVIRIKPGQVRGDDSVISFDENLPDGTQPNTSSIKIPYDIGAVPVEFEITKNGDEITVWARPLGGQQKPVLTIKLSDYCKKKGPIAIFTRERVAGDKESTLEELTIEDLSKPVDPTMQQ